MAPVRMESKNTGRFLVLDSWRGICACLIIFLHTSANSPLFGLPFVRHAYLFVDFFFVLSGFVIAWNYEKKLHSWLLVKKFVFLRIGRLWPLHLAILGLYFASESAKYLLTSSVAFNNPAFAYWQPWNVVGNIFLMPELFFTNEKFYFNPPTWSIAAEFYAYLIFAVLCFAKVSRSRYLAIFAAVATVVAIIIHPEENVAIHALMRSTIGFAVGCLCARTVSVYQSKNPGMMPKRRWLWSCLESGCVVLIVLFVSLAGATRWESLAVLVFAAAVLVYALEFGALSAVLKTRGIVWLGTLSYSIYMTHWFLLEKVISVGNLERLFHRKLSVSVLENGVNVSRYGVTPVQGTLFYIVILAVTLIFSALTYRFIEEPARLWTRARCNPKRPKIEGVQPQSQL